MGQLRVVQEARILGAWQRAENSVEGTTRRRWAVAAREAHRIGALWAAGAVDLATERTLAEERVFGARRFTAELTIMLAGWEDALCRQESHWARALWAQPRGPARPAALWG